MYKRTWVADHPILLENKSFWKSALAIFLALIFLFRFLIKQKMKIEKTKLSLIKNEASNLEY